jgi:hypothetical protein
MRRTFTGLDVHALHGSGAHFLPSSVIPCSRTNFTTWQLDAVEAERDTAVARLERTVALHKRAGGASSACASARDSVVAHDE